MSAPTKGTHKGGRPTKLNDKVQEALVEALRNGCYRETAIRAAGISSTTFARWMEQGEADEEHGKESAHRELRAAIIQAEAEGELDAVEIIRTAAHDTWQAAAWFLERKYPARWGRKYRAEIESTVTADVEVVHNKVVELTPEEAKRMEVAKTLGVAYGLGVNGN